MDTEDRKLSPKEVEEVTGLPRNQWSSRISGGYAPPPDGYYPPPGNRPWWYESTIRAFLRWSADPVLSKAPSKAERFAAWLAQQRNAGAQPVTPAEPSIRSHRSFKRLSGVELTDELSSLVPNRVDEP